MRRESSRGSVAGQPQPSGGEVQFMAKKRGINPKDWFYSFKTSLKKRRRMVRQRLAGSVAEQWLNVEFFCWLQKTLRKSGLPYVTYNELRKTDAAVFCLDSGEIKWSKPIAVMEAKAIYSAYNKGLIRKKIAGLLDQLEDRREVFPTARIFGLIYGIYAHWHGQKRRDGTFGDYRRTIKMESLKIAEGRARLAKPCMERVLDASDVSLAAGLKAHVGMCAQLVELPKT